MEQSNLCSSHGIFVTIQRECDEKDVQHELGL